MLANAAAVDAAIYTVEPPYCIDTDWPALPYCAPVNVPTIAKKAKVDPATRTDGLKVVNLDGVVHPATDTTLATVLEPRIEVYKPVIMNYEVAKIKGGFAVPYFNEQPLRIPMGQRKMTPFTCWYSAGSDEFWYHFEVMPGMVVGYSETTLKKLNGVG